MRFILPLALAVALAIPLVAQPKAVALPNQGLEIVQRFGGTAKMVVSDAMESKEPAPLLIQDQAAFEKFTTLLPANEVSRTVPTPNQDPLIKVPRFDWSRFFLLVVFDSQSLSFPPNVSRVEIQENKLVAFVEYPDTKSLIESPPEYGSYGAALVVRSDKTLEWSNPGHKAQEAQRQSMMMFLPDAK